MGPLEIREFVASARQRETDGTILLCVRGRLLCDDRRSRSGGVYRKDVESLALTAGAMEGQRAEEQGESSEG